MTRSLVVGRITIITVAKLPQSRMERYIFCSTTVTRSLTALMTFQQMILRGDLNFFGKEQGGKSRFFITGRGGGGCQFFSFTLVYFFNLLMFSRCYT